MGEIQKTGIRCMVGEVGSILGCDKCDVLLSYMYTASHYMNPNIDISVSYCNDASCKGMEMVGIDDDGVGSDSCRGQ
jgi:hypothetical protein